jgi:uncharacterized protein YicC (UPF0701 family)
MTGFGKLLCNYQPKKITVKSLNSKGLDLNVRMPCEMELGLRNQIALKLERGKVDFLFYRKYMEQTSTKVNVPL